MLVSGAMSRCGPIGRTETFQSDGQSTSVGNVIALMCS